MRISWVRSNLAFALYGLVLVWIIIGVVSQENWGAVQYLLFYGGVLTLLYVLLRAQAMKRVTEIHTMLDRVALPGGWEIAALRMLALIAVALAIYVVSHMGEANIWQAMRNNQTQEIVLIRQNILAGSPALVHYATSLLLKGILPCLVLISFCLKRWWIFGVVVLVSILFAIALMQNSPVIFIFMPLFIYALFHRQYLMSLMAFLLIAGVIWLMMATTAPFYRPAFWFDYNAPKPIHTALLTEIKTTLGTTNTKTELVRDQSAFWKILKIGEAVTDRVVLVPGRVVSQWFTLLPEKVPFVQGCGYRFMAPFLGCTHQNIPLLLYEKLYPEHVAIGMRGSVNVASMMEDYANFGVIGLVLAAFILATLLALVQVIFTGAESLIIPFNVVYIMGLSSFSLYTTLASGGWLVSLAMYVLFRKALRFHLTATRSS
jgi:hypothetical protein